MKEKGSWASRALNNSGCSFASFLQVAFRYRHENDLSNTHNRISKTLLTQVHQQPFHMSNMKHKKLFVMSWALTNPDLQKTVASTQWHENRSGIVCMQPFLLLRIDVPSKVFSCGATKNERCSQILVEFLSWKMFPRALSPQTESCIYNTAVDRRLRYVPRGYLWSRICIWSEEHSTAQCAMQVKSLGHLANSETFSWNNLYAFSNMPSSHAEGAPDCQHELERSGDGRVSAMFRGLHVQEGRHGARVSSRVILVRHDTILPGFVNWLRNSFCMKSNNTFCAREVTGFQTFCLWSDFFFHFHCLLWAAAADLSKLIEQVRYLSHTEPSVHSIHHNNVRRCMPEINSCPFSFPVVDCPHASCEKSRRIAPYLQKTRSRTTARRFSSSSSAQPRPPSCWASWSAPSTCSSPTSAATGRPKRPRRRLRRRTSSRPSRIWGGQAKTGTRMLTK